MQAEHNQSTGKAALCRLTCVKVAVSF
jgi:hypothetical protein